MIFANEFELTTHKYEVFYDDTVIEHEGYGVSYKKLLEIPPLTKFAEKFKNKVELEILPLTKFAEKFKNKVELDIQSLMEVAIPEKYKVCKYIAEYLDRYMALEELLKVKIFGDINNSRLYHYIKIVPIFQSSEKSLEISEELENNIYESPMSNRILVFSIFK